MLDTAGRELVTGSFGYLSSLYKVIDSTDGAVFFVHDYYPSAISLYDRFLKVRMMKGDNVLECCCWKCSYC